MQQREWPAQSITEAEAARYLGITRSFLTASRLTKPRTSGPPYVRLGRAVRYLVADLDAWLQSNRVSGAQAENGTDTTNPPAA